MGEHGLYNKGSPYKTSAGVPFIIRFPRNITEGKVVETAFTSPDFAPTILSIMGIDHSDVNFQGIDGSGHVLNSEDGLINKKDKKEQKRFIYGGTWASIVDDRYKLVLSNTDEPYLFDLKKNPSETINFYFKNSKYKRKAESLGWRLMKAMKKYHFKRNSTVFLDKPPCQDSKDQIPHLLHRVCDDLLLDKYKNKCKLKDVSNFCPNTCSGSCCKDSTGTHVRTLKWKKCKNITRERDCKNESVQKFCPLKCNVCITQNSMVETEI